MRYVYESTQKDRTAGMSVCVLHGQKVDIKD